VTKRQSSSREAAGPDDQVARDVNRKTAAAHLKTREGGSPNASFAPRCSFKRTCAERLSLQADERRVGHPTDSPAESAGITNARRPEDSTLAGCCTRDNSGIDSAHPRTAVWIVNGRSEICSTIKGFSLQWCRLRHPLRPALATTVVIWRTARMLIYAIESDTGVENGGSPHSTLPLRSARLRERGLYHCGPLGASNQSGAGSPGRHNRGAPGG
jgi:hypothetical protein